MFRRDLDVLEDFEKKYCVGTLDPDKFLLLENIVTELKRITKKLERSNKQTLFKKLARR